VHLHHERWDGKGYPEGLEGNTIPLMARILAVADSYDAMTSNRAYRKALAHKVAMEELRRCSGTQFDPDLVDAFRRAIEAYRKEAMRRGEVVPP
jgi:HD-GYP domain-containing protein (c-di-GMP phosphodiesterase class II)